MIQRVHHINFVVRDLELAVERYQSLFGIGPFELLQHPHRPVKTARAKLGETWIVLVQPLDKESPPAKHLQEHGEGFFLISYQVDDLDAAMERVSTRDGKLRDKTPRNGILNWQVCDLDPESTFGALVQLVEEK